ncbi:type I-E CRISPR-associated endoribonuclease Cas2 [Streptomyces goshikiensis]|uniref:type I-E CRISPR-associated endoribonuclease Cas2 n=1 Tax=Streptomyces goshikiensis TaxID=1942 RepID=UPI003241EEEA
MGGPSARVRAALWEEARRYDGMARALLTYNTNNKQGLAFEAHAASGTRLITKVSR